MTLDLVKAQTLSIIQVLFQIRSGPNMMVGPWAPSFLRPDANHWIHGKMALSQKFTSVIFTNAEKSLTTFRCVIIAPLGLPGDTYEQNKVRIQKLHPRMVDVREAHKPHIIRAPDASNVRYTVKAKSWVTPNSWATCNPLNEANYLNSLLTRDALIRLLCRSDQISRSVVSDSLRPHESQHARPPCPLPTPRVHWDSRPSSQWWHPAISSSVVAFFSCPQSLPTSECFPMSQLFAWGDQCTGISALASFLPKRSQGWSPSERTGWISL